MQSETILCTVCGEAIPSGRHHDFDDQELCNSCLETETTFCHNCGERIWQDANMGDPDAPLCERCYENHYTTCERCGRSIHRDDACYFDDEPLCYICHDERASHSAIHDYSHRPEPLFYGTGRRYFGVELEIDEAGESSKNAEALLSIANRSGELLYCKHDGSLDEGFELVTHPMTLDFHQNEMPWADVLSCAVAMGYRSHQASTCGLHVHVSRTAFGSSTTEQESCIARILYFFEKHWEELLKFSRRTARQLDRWAARYGYKEQPKDILAHAKSGYGSGRYSCVNLQNYDTIEFRIFRGTLKHNTIIATLQMVNHLCNVAISLSDEELKGLSWTSFVAGISPESAAELVRYLKERRLYVNEPVDMEVEL